MGIDTIYRGQRRDDMPRGPIEHGHRDMYGVKYLFPIYEWSREDVFEYVRKECPDLMPSNYANGELSSRDCWDCTAYRSHNKQRVKNLDDKARLIVEGRLRKWQSCVRHEMSTDMES
jgi:phosphoadenosine phosphosulfate reductase